ncbi:helix-turn-helix domain-containing protein [Pararhodobacter aggregans]|uniref:XRE family transcriptional regulator n=1 Tax=Pararhodobacter aggregans TaxID=404875 RepID=A0A2T7UT55_9RHOB|nr:XRE family transcriptional regulator [Pararhodobacter aggregans]PTX02718.1 XRE family transcriptional regulator [Pararhodobacter aggregans]PVE47950.1 XRE family transcriptional regulator [Pararhodobacter aggregans]
MPPRNRALARPDPTEMADSQRAEFGSRLKELRRARGWTLAQLAERSGLAVSTISKAERGLMSLTYDRMLSLARGIGVDMAEFFTAEGAVFAPGSFAVAPKGVFQKQETRNYVYEMLFPEIRNKAMVPMMGTLKAHDLMDFDDFVRHPGQEFLLVLEGAVTVFAEGKAPVLLRQGDSLYFDSSRGHLYASAGAVDARILVVCTEVEGGA